MNTLLEPDPSLVDIRESAAKAAGRRHLEYNESVLRHLLGQWASELEPTMVIAGNGSLVGLGYGDGPNVVVWAPSYPRKPKSLDAWLREIMTGRVFP